MQRPKLRSKFDDQSAWNKKSVQLVDVPWSAG